MTIAPSTSDADGDALTLEIASDPAHGTAAVNGSGGITYSPAADYVGEDLFTYTASDGEATSAAATVTVTVNAVNDAPTVGAVADVTAVYSDPIPSITITASDQDGGSTGLTFSQTGLPAGLALTSAGGTATISGTVTGAPGSAPVTVTACDAGGACDSTSFTIVVSAETATVRLAQNNPHAVPVVRGTAPAITFTGRITDAADGSFGDVARIQGSNVSVTLRPVGGGTPATCSASITRRVAATVTSPGFVDVSCAFAAGVKIDVYEVALAVNGSFVGADYSLLTVYDPASRGASGAGFLTLPNGNTGEFAFSASSSNKGVKGKVAFLERNPNGVVVNTVFGPNLQTIAVSTTSPLTATITGKAVVNGAGNYGLIVTAIDGGTAADRVGLKISAPAGAPSVPSLSFGPINVSPGGAVIVR